MPRTAHMTGPTSTSCASPKAAYRHHAGAGTSYSAIQEATGCSRATISGGGGVSFPRSDRWCRRDARRFEPAGFSFAPVGLDLLLLAFRPWLFGRGWIRSGEFGGPPLFAPFSKVEGD